MNPSSRGQRREFHTAQQRLKVCVLFVCVCVSAPVPAGTASELVLCVDCAKQSKRGKRSKGKEADSRRNAQLEGKHLQGCSPAALRCQQTHSAKDETRVRRRRVGTQIHPRCLIRSTFITASAALKPPRADLHRFTRVGRDVVCFPSR